MRVYRFNPKLRPDYNPQPAVMPKLPRCIKCHASLGEAAPYQQRRCDDCRRQVAVDRVRRYREQHAKP